MLRVERLLQLRQALPEFLDLLNGVRLRIPSRLGGIDLRETNLVAWPNEDNTILAFCFLVIRQSASTLGATAGLGKEDHVPNYPGKGALQIALLVKLHHRGNTFTLEP